MKKSVITYLGNNKFHIEFDIDLGDYLFLVCFIRGIRDGSITVDDINNFNISEVMKWTKSGRKPPTLIGG